MARPSHVLNLLIVPRDPDARPIGPAEAVLAALRERGCLLADGSAGPAAQEWVPGGFDRLWLDTPEGVALYANQPGGFRVFCPNCEQNLSGPFTHAWSAFRDHRGARTLVCPACARPFALESVDFRPPAALGRLALYIANAQGRALTPWGQALVDELLGPTHTIWRRS